MLNKIGVTEEFINCLIISVIAIVGITCIKSVNVWFVNRYHKDAKVKYKYNKVLSYVYMLIVVFILGVSWRNYIPNIMTFLGLFTAGIAFALRDGVASLVGGVYILVSNPFTTGDRVEINGIKGDVVDIELSNFTLLEVGGRVKGEQSTGRLVHIPNSYIFVHPLKNYEKGFEYIWSELEVKLTVDSDLDKAKNLLYEIVDRNTGDVSHKVDNQINEANRNYMITYNNLTPIVYNKIENGFLVLTLRYLAKPRKARMFDNAIWGDIYKTFSSTKGIYLIGLYGEGENLLV